MRRFVDRAGAEWDVVLGRESWGALVALFVPVRARGPILQTPLGAPDAVSAERELDAMAVEGLQLLLDRSTEKEG
jgi:hypothetical protein